MVVSLHFPSARDLGVCCHALPLLQLLPVWSRGAIFKACYFPSSNVNSLIPVRPSFSEASVNSRKDKSLRVMSQKFVMLFLVSTPQIVSLEIAAKILIGEDHVEDLDKSKFKSKCHNYLGGLGTIHERQTFTHFDWAPSRFLGTCLCSISAHLPHPHPPPLHPCTGATANWWNSARHKSCLRSDTPLPSDTATVPFYMVTRSQDFSEQSVVN